MDEDEDDEDEDEDAYGDGIELPDGYAYRWLTRGSESLVLYSWRWVRVRGRVGRLRMDFLGLVGVGVRVGVGERGGVLAGVLVGVRLARRNGN